MKIEPALASQKALLPEAVPGKPEKEASMEIENKNAWSVLSSLAGINAVASTTMHFVGEGFYSSLGFALSLSVPPLFCLIFALFANNLLTFAKRVLLGLIFPAFYLLFLSIL